MIKVGIRAHDLGKYAIEDFPQLLATVKSTGAQCIQLALGKSFIDFSLSKENLNKDLGNFLKTNLDEKNINLSVLGCYINMANPDNDKRLQEIEKFRYHLDFSKNFPNCIVGTETGCLNTEYVYTPLNDSKEAFDLFLDTLKKLVFHAEESGTSLAIEGVKKHIISTPEKMSQVLEIVPSKNLKVIFDPVNFMDLSNFKSQKQIIETSFELFADRIQIIHLKDFIIENDKFKVVPIGEGIFDIETLMKCIKKYNLNVDILLENCDIQTANKCINFTKNSYKRIVDNI